MIFTALKIILQTHKQLQIHDFYDYYYHFLSQSSLSRFSLFSKFSKKKITMCQIVLTILTFWLLVDFNPHGPNASKYIQIVAHHHGKMNEYFVDPTLISTLLQNDVKLQHYLRTEIFHVEYNVGISPIKMSHLKIHLFILQVQIFEISLSQTCPKLQFSKTEEKLKIHLRRRRSLIHIFDRIFQLVKFGVHICMHMTFYY